MLVFIINLIIFILFFIIAITFFFIADKIRAMNENIFDTGINIFGVFIKGNNLDAVVIVIIGIISMLIAHFIVKYVSRWILKPFSYYNAIIRMDVENVKKHLEAGSNPNYCKMPYLFMRWGLNPLGILAAGFCGSVTVLKSNTKIEGDIPDVSVLNLLVEAGADINRQPYVWERVYFSRDFKLMKQLRRERPLRLRNIDKEEEKEIFMNDVNRLLEAFLKAGANPDMLGHPYPFNKARKFPSISDEKAKKYFEKGSRPINLAIEKGIAWESQVDLLLQYTKLDEESLVAAERSKDAAMIEKIKKLWLEYQN